MRYLSHMKSLARPALLVAAFLLPSLAFAATTVVGGVSSNGSWFFGIGSGNLCGNALCSIGSTILYLINAVAVPLLFAISFIVFLFGIANAYILSHGDPAKVKQGHQLILWGLIGFAVMISVWGLVNVVANTFGLTGSSAPALPTSY